MRVLTKVAKILDEEHVLLAAGEADGVKPGFHFVVFEEGEEVLHPDTGESLGKFEQVKGTVVVEHVQPLLSLAVAPPEEGEDFESTVLSARLARADPLSSARTHRQKLYVQAHEAAGWSPPKPISVGDLARSIEEIEGGPDGAHEEADPVDHTG